MSPHISSRPSRSRPSNSQDEATLSAAVDLGQTRQIFLFLPATLKLFYVVNTMNRCKLNELLAIYMQLVRWVVVVK
jgi:hypothetical protein